MNSSSSQWHPYSLMVISKQCPHLIISICFKTKYPKIISMLHVHLQMTKSCYYRWSCVHHMCIMIMSAFPPRSTAPLCGILWPSQQLLTLPESTTKTTSGMVTPVSAMLVPQVTSKHINTLHPSPVVPLVNDALTVNDMLTYVTVASSLADSVQYFHGLSWFHDLLLFRIDESSPHGLQDFGWLWIVFC